MKPTILTTQHIKPTHLHSHLLLPPHTGKRSKSKRECKQPHPFTADQTVNKVDNSVYIQLRQHFGQTEGQLITAPTINWRFSAPQTHLWLIKIGSPHQHLW
jgi:hypothetical protein